MVFNHIEVKDKLNEISAKYGFSLEDLDARVLDLTDINISLKVTKGNKSYEVKNALKDIEGNQIVLFEDFEQWIMELSDFHSKSRM